MTSACSVCLLMLRQISPINDGRISHGLCKEHALAMLIAGGMCTIEEVGEYAGLRCEYETLTVKVPPHVAAGLRALSTAVEYSSGRSADPELLAGLALARELNRMEYEPVQITGYVIPEPRLELAAGGRELLAKIGVKLPGAAS